MTRTRRRSLRPQLDSVALESRTLLSLAAMPAVEVRQQTTKFRELVIRGQFTIQTYDWVTTYDSTFDKRYTFKLTGFGRSDQLSRLKLDGEGTSHWAWKYPGPKDYSMRFETRLGDSFTVNCSSSGFQALLAPGLPVLGTVDPSMGTGRFAGVKGRIYTMGFDPPSGHTLPQGVHRATFTLTLLRPVKGTSRPS